MDLRTIVISLVVLFMVGNTKSQWITEVNYTQSYTLNYVNIVDSTQAWVVGNYQTNYDSSIVLRWTSFTTWVQYFPDIANNNHFTCIAGQDSNNVWIGTATGRVYYLDILGNNYVQQINVGGQGYINDIKFSRINRNFGYAFSDPPGGAGTAFKIYKTTNGGMNWIEYSPIFGGSYVGTYSSMYVSDSNHVWLGLNCQSSNCGVPMVAYTTNGGVNWLTSAIPNGSNSVTSIAFKYDNIYGIVAPWDQIPTYLYKSNNGGNTWSFLYNTQLNQSVQNIGWASGTNVWYFCSIQPSLTPIQKSTNDGLSWFSMDSPQGYDQVSSMDIIRQGAHVYGKSVTYNGRIMGLVDTASIIGIHNIESQVPEKYSLSQNYPNPFNPSTIIKYSIPKTSMVKLVVYDILGNQVMTLVNGTKLSGNYEAKFDGSNLASGVYFYKLEAGDFRDVKKMLMVK